MPVDDHTALEAALEDMQVLQARHQFTGQPWARRTDDQRMCVIGLGIRQEDMAVLILYKYVVPMKVWPEEMTPTPIWAYPVNDFLADFRPLGREKGTYTKGVMLDGREQE